MRESDGTKCSRRNRTGSPNRKGRRPRSRGRKIPTPRIARDFPVALRNKVREDLRIIDPGAVGIWESCKDNQDNAAAHAVIQSIGRTEVAPSQVGGAMLLGSLIRKFQWPGNDESCTQAALAKIRQSEEQCREFNVHRWKAFFEGRPETTEHMFWFISKVIGLIPPTLEVLVDAMRHGPGAAVETQGTCLYDKYRSVPYSVTSAALPHARRVIATDPQWVDYLSDNHPMVKVCETCGRLSEVSWNCPDDCPAFDGIFKVVDTNRVAMVPKDSSEHRGIAIEPLLNVYLQLGVDGFIRRRLKKWGIDIDCQAWNALAAKKGSEDGSLATLDLSSASDTVSLRLMRELLPPAWFSLLCDLRSPKGLLPTRETLRYSKISSMGNGYTFALETLVFSAICFAAAQESGIGWRRAKPLVYGDDIVVPVALVPRTLAFLKAAGFTVNSSKSFTQGPFRESCGADWYRGHFVRPVFLKEQPRTIPDLFVLHNRLRYWAYQVYGDPDALSETLRWLRAVIPKGYRFEGPESNDDFGSYLHVSDYKGTFHPRAGTRWTYKTIVFRPRRWPATEFKLGKLMLTHLLRQDHKVGPIELHDPLDFVVRRISWNDSMDPERRSGGRATLRTRPTAIERTRRDVGSLECGRGVRLTPGSYRPHAENLVGMTRV